MKFASYETVHSILSPVDASKLSGRYEATDEVSGKPCRRSIRFVKDKDQLVLQGTITPNKKAVVPSAEDVDCLCDLFESKARVTPRKKTRKSASNAKAPSGRSAWKKGDEARENDGGTSKKATKKSARFDKAVASPARRSNRRRSYSIDLSN